MLPIVMNSKVGKDGVLHLSVSLGPGDADRDVRVIVEPLAIEGAMTPEEWRARVQSLAGSWRGEFERPPQGEYEDRDPLS